MASTHLKIKLGISACLLGEKVRYDGGHKLDPFLKDTLGRFVEWVPVCPEVEFGLPVPREPMRLVGSPDAPRLVTVKTQVDRTDAMRAWAGQRVAELGKHDLSGFVFKSKSPSSGLYGVKVYGTSGPPAKKGVGIFAQEFVKRFPLVPAEDDGRLFDPGLRENFIERVFVYQRWQELTAGGLRPKDLVAFHTDHKLLVLAHSTRHYTELGRLVSSAGKTKPAELADAYLGLLMEGLRLTATRKKTTNVLHHVAGYFKKQLSPDEKQELQDVIGQYHRGLVPLVVPVVLLNHYVRKYDEPYLKRQYFLNPHPAELMLRNHA
ncbi:MAG: DUF523 and DUF1722 domain-containing protein [Thermodesulfovibrionales bacterium]